LENEKNHIFPVPIFFPFLLQISRANDVRVTLGCQSFQAGDRQPAKLGIANRTFSMPLGEHDVATGEHDDLLAVPRADPDRQICLLVDGRTTEIVAYFQRPSFVCSSLVWRFHLL
jgi:hypothetical protein